MVKGKLAVGVEELRDKVCRLVDDLRDREGKKRIQVKRRSFKRRDSTSAIILTIVITAFTLTLTSLCGTPFVFSRRLSRAVERRRDQIVVIGGPDEDVACGRDERAGGRRGRRGRGDGGVREGPRA